MIITFENNSIESYQEMLQQLNVQTLEVLQLSNGLYKGKTSCFLLPNIRLSIQSKNECTILHKGKFSDDEFVIPLRIEGPLHIINGVCVHINALNLIGPGEYVYTQSYCARTIATIGVSKNHLISYLGEEKVSQLLDGLTLIRDGKIEFCKMKKIKIELYRYIIQIFHQREVFSQQSLIDIEEQLSVMICQLLEINSNKLIPQPCFNHRLVIVQRAINYIDSEPNVNIPIPRILDFSHCSLRSLEYAFNSIIGISPQRYLKIRRMHLIRRELIHRQQCTIKEVVSKYGIVNIGRFSHDFYTLFGQYPKEI
ncbi:helix-turn-helix domain-containing protein [Colwellia sp. UCD-KL20]|uniref:helix-turn-helix domain-containing protein n=1 Tax=Colwellia sp. UCD-KL20 TaxID=1917165 RepID=UPI0009709E71|nr:helix-turn-helix domain-containing protein [Colwellia sp. UCD-KL20]